jgi:hypothetical protein
MFLIKQCKKGLVAARQQDESGIRDRLASRLPEEHKNSRQEGRGNNERSEG